MKQDQTIKLLEPRARWRFPPVLKPVLEEVKAQSQTLNDTF